MRHFTTISPVVLLFATVALFGCGGAGGGSDVTGTPTPTPPPPPGTPNSVVVNASSFTPTDLAVNAGTTVTWTWNACTGADGYGTGQPCVTHDVVFDDGSAGSGTMSEGTFSRSFATAGTYAYHCAIHGAAAMSGRVIVK